MNHPDINPSMPEECALWRTAEPTIDQLRSAFEPVATFADDSHMVRKLLRCRECGHLYFYESYEEIDWQEGKDGQYRTWIPVDDRESAETLSRLSIIDVLMYPSVRYDHPKGADVPRGPAWFGRKGT